MHDYHQGDIREQVLNGIVFACMIISWPFIKLFQLVRWFVRAVVKEVGTTMVKYVAGAISVGLIALITHYFQK